MRARDGRDSRLSTYKTRILLNSDQSPFAQVTTNVRECMHPWLSEVYILTFQSAYTNFGGTRTVAQRTLLKSNYIRFE